MDVPLDTANWTRDQKLDFLNAVAGDEDYSLDPYPLLKTLMADGDPEVRALTLSALWDYAGVDLIAPLFDLALNDPSPEVRAKAIATLGRYIYEGDVADYEYDWGELSETMRAEELPRAEFLRVKDFLVRLARDISQPTGSLAAAVEALSFLDDPEVTALIKHAYRHGGPEMKVSAIFAMGRSGNRRWSQYILKELVSPVPELQMEAVRAAGEAYLEEAGPALRQIAETGDHEMQLEAVWALGRTGGPGVERFLTERAESTDPEMREVAGAALEELELTEMESEDGFSEDDEDDEAS